MKEGGAMPNRCIHYRTSTSIKNDSSNLWLILPRQLEALMQMKTVIDFVNFGSLKSTPPYR